MGGRGRAGEDGAAFRKILSLSHYGHMPQGTRLNHADLLTFSYVLSNSKSRHHACILRTVACSEERILRAASASILTGE